MADIRVKDLDEAATPGADYFLLTDSATDGVKKIKPSNTVTRASLSIDNVDNTSDVNKPISTATQTALDAKANASSLATVATSGAYNDLSGKPILGSVAALNVGLGPNNIPQLDSSGRMPAIDGSQLTGLAGGGDMVASVYDLNGVHADAFDLANIATFTRSQALTKSLPAAQMAFATSGYSVPGDGGAGAYIRVSTPGVVKPWHAQLADGSYWQLNVSTVHPKHFGAVLDGVADDTAAIQAWADYASTFNVKAVGQPGTANIPTGQLVLSSNTTIEGGFLTLKRSTDTVLSLVKGSAVSNIRIRDLGLQHSAGMTSTTSAAMGLTTKNFNIGAGKVGLVVNNFVQISAVSDPRNYEIARINSYSGGVLNVTATTSVGSGTFANWYIDSYPLNGDTAESNIAVYLVGCSKVWVENCVVTGRFYNGLDSRDGNDIWFSKNYVSGVVNRGIHLGAYTALSNNNNCNGNVVYGNSITQYGINTSGTGTGILQSCHVSCNTVSNPLFQGVEMGGAAQWGDISGNSVIMNIGANYGVGILMQVLGSKQPRSIVVTGNTIQGAEQGIAILDCIYWSITGNRVTSSQTGYYIYGSAAGPNVYGTISGNGADNCTNYGYLLSAAAVGANTGHVVSGNSASAGGTGFAIGANNSGIALVGNVSLGNTTAYVMSAVGGSTNIGNV